MASPSLVSAFRVAIIGAGFSGTLLAVQLLRQSKKPLEVTLIDSDSRHIGRGVAYSTTHSCHLLNVPAGNMSALPDDADHFLRWALKHQQSLINPPFVTCVDEAAFLPRKSYGEYLNHLLAETAQSSSEGMNLNLKEGEVVAANELSDGIALTLVDGATLVADKVVLALGNFHRVILWLKIHRSTRANGITVIHGNLGFLRKSLKPNPAC